MSLREPMLRGDAGASHETAQGTEPNRTNRVLLADDDPAARFMIEDILSEWGYDLVVAADGLEAFEILCGEDAPQLALLDWMMPKMDGPQICTQSRQMQSVPFVYFIILTSKTEKEDITTALDAGANDFLSKPVDPGELRSRLQVGVRTVAYERTLVEKNEQLDRYATQMEALAEERARQLVHAERLSVLGTLTAGFAHEISNPLNVILGNAELLHATWDEIAPPIRRALENDGANMELLRQATDETPRMLRDIQAGAEQTARLVRGLKRFSRKDDEWISQCLINDCVERALRLGHSRFKNWLTIETELDPDLPLTRAKPQQLEQVFLNLFLNAADAMKPQEDGILRITSRHEGDKVVVVVEDTGPGIPPDALDTIWEPFFTTKGPEEGTGLGLSISRGIIEEHEGTLYAENRPHPGGARFTIEIPLDRGG